MSNIISKIRQRIALKKDSKFNLSCDHITTSDFFKLSPVYFKEMVPGEKINIKMATFSRLSPMVKPMYGRCRIENRAFFVPMRTIFKGWNEFITDVPYNNIFLLTPVIYPQDLYTVFTDAEFSLAVETIEYGTTPYDFETVTPQGSSTLLMGYRRFTTVGKQAWTILQSLGYRFPLGMNTADVNNDFKMSALPLLAFFKVYKDWYKSQAYQTTLFDGIFEISANIAQTSGRLSAAVLKPLLGLCGRVNYDKDYFSSAWDRPTAPNNGLNSSNSIPDITSDKTGAKSLIRNGNTSNANLNGATPSIVQSSDGVSPSSGAVQNLTQYAVDALKALTDYMKRHQLAGGLAMDRMLSRFGVKPSDAALDRSTYIGKNTVDVLIADVMATANGESTINDTTNKSALGEYAGKGVAFGKDGFSYSTDEYGYILILSSIVPSIGYVQGMSRYCMHLDKLDFFTPEFDSLGVQAIARKELVSDYNQHLNGIASNYTGYLNGVFGYTSRYAEYKTQQDQLTGDFTCGSLNTGMEAWHLNRLIGTGNTTPSYNLPGAAGWTTDKVSHSLNFVRPSDASQYDRVFAYQGTDYDHFYNIYHFEITDYAPMTQLFDDYEFDGGSKDVTIDINGTQLN